MRRDPVPRSQKAVPYAPSMGQFINVDTMTSDSPGGLSAHNTTEEVQTRNSVGRSRPVHIIEITLFSFSATDPLRSPTTCSVLVSLMARLTLVRWEVFSKK